MNQWLLVFAIIGSTMAADVLQSREMKRHGEVANLGGVLGALRQRGYLMLSVVFMAISFFSFMALLSIADLSFAVPATALSMVGETALAKYYLREDVSAARWLGAALVACGVMLLSH